MPRIHTVKLEQYADGCGHITGPEMRVDISGNFASDLASAVSTDHYCNDNHCDITAAREAGFPMVAAGLLSGATECPTVFVTVAAHRFNGTTGGVDPLRDVYAVPEWDAWKAYFDDHATECPGCGSYNFDSEACDNCGHGY